MDRIITSYQKVNGHTHFFNEEGRRLYYTHGLYAVVNGWKITWQIAGRAEKDYAMVASAISLATSLEQIVKYAPANGYELNISPERYLLFKKVVSGKGASAYEHRVWFSFEPVPARPQCTVADLIKVKELLDAQPIPTRDPLPQFTPLTRRQFLKTLFCV